MINAFKDLKKTALRTMTTLIWNIAFLMKREKVNDTKPLSTGNIAPQIVNELNGDDDLVIRLCLGPITAAKAVASEDH